MTDAWIDTNFPSINLYAVWISSTLNLFSPNNQYTSVTGGWTNSGWSCYDDTMAKTSSVGATLVARIDGLTYGSSTIGTANAIDLTNYKTLHLTADKVKGGTIVAVSTTKSICSTKYFVHESYYGDLTNYEIKINVSGLTGKYYIGITSRGSQTITWPKITVSKVWLTT